MRFGLFNSIVLAAVFIAVGTTNAIKLKEIDPSKVPSQLTQSSTDSGVNSEAYANLAAELKTMTDTDCGAEAEAMTKLYSDVFASLGTESKAQTETEAKAHVGIDSTASAQFFSKLASMK